MKKKKTFLLNINLSFLEEYIVFMLTDLIKKEGKKNISIKSKCCICGDYYCGLLLA